MTAYLIVFRESPVRDQAAIDDYSRNNRAHAQMFREYFGLSPLAVYGRTEALEGSAPDAALILRFPTMDDARNWYDSPEYQATLALRTGAADWRVVLVEGLD